ncbi:helix-turn-helix transcriptional regulator [Bacillus pseudomycoides]|uniref:Transcriptional regulator n=1 Tax=Bacillus pseudomycoides TaxID=64104 RepID=A0ABD6SYU8_9BACI|nr:YafY family protein [Bacillus pseudomycoides]PEM33828.1 transcriptional regulator [Bacillus pseudomycoides]PEP71363.1 transcriptional regulator [Bacillus pseudomycoides]PFW88090.1 transcriptional regulator [Bacillus pseudomycoides]PFX42759.1 transcriptional regulator [Bacillus pseudomycoides]PGF06224.1 transcriptional regulator [Bacillus pseudomycoides]
MKLERLLSIIYKLLNHEVLSASMLAEEFQVSQRTIYRDIDVICAAGFPVVSYQGSNGGYGMMDGYKMDKSLLGSYDVNSLITVLRSLSTVFKDKRAQGTIERLQTIGLEHHVTSLSVDLETHRMEPDALRHLRTSITQKNIVRFDYINAKNERTTRDMEPLRLHFKYRNWYIFGFCRTRRDYREFRLSRLMNLYVTQETFQPHHEVPEEVALSRKGWQDQLEDVVIRVGREALAEAMDQFHQVDKQFHADGSMTMRIPVYKPLRARWLWSILLSFGSGAEVLEPLALRGIIKEQLQNALKLYEDV